jgi:hypothetical protein
MGAGLSGNAFSAVDPTTGEIYVLGPPSSGTYTFIDNIGIWNGSSWNTLDIDLQDRQQRIAH